MKLTETEKEYIRQSHAKGFSGRWIAQGLGRGKSTINDFLKKEAETNIKNAPRSHSKPSSDVLRKKEYQGSEVDTKAHTGAYRDSDENKPKVLFFDIETAPEVVYTFKRFKAFVSPSQVIRHPYVIGWAAKWANSDEVISSTLLDYHTNIGCDHGDDCHLVNELAALIDEADVIIAHNIKFDFPWVQGRLMYHGLYPTSPVRLIDTLQIAKKEFKLPSNSLDAIARYLGLEVEKIKTDFDLWAGCDHGDKESFREMERYNRMDVVVLQEIYRRMAPFYRQHPNLQLFGSLSGCTVCGSENIKLIDKLTATNVSLFHTYQCQECGKMMRGRNNILKKDDKQDILTNAG